MTAQHLTSRSRFSSSTLACAYPYSLTPHLSISPITRAALAAKIDRGDRFHLFEVLPTMYWRKHHLPGAKSLPPDQVQELVPRLVSDKRDEIVLYCWNFT
jgi:hypothetical protein